jgi:DNA-binding transcriptional regulator YdaS (Cro superfamily)
MGALVSALSSQARATIAISYTTALLVSEVTKGEISPEEVNVEWLDWAREEIDRQTGMCFRSLDFTDELNGNGLLTVFTRCFPLIDVFKVTIDGEVIPPEEYVVNKRTGSITLRRGIFTEGLQNVSVNGIHGYRTVPPLIQKIATLMVAKTALASKCGRLVDSQSIGGFSQSKSLKKINDELDRAWAAWGKRFPIGFV